MTKPSFKKHNNVKLSITYDEYYKKDCINANVIRANSVKLPGIKCLYKAQNMMRYNIEIDGYIKNFSNKSSAVLWIGTTQNNNIFFPLDDSKYHLTNKPKKISYTYYHNSLDTKIFIGIIIKKNFKNQIIVINELTMD